jgi:hypothetical protein
MLWGGVIGLLLHELFYHVGASDRYSYVSWNFPTSRMK